MLGVAIKGFGKTTCTYMQLKRLYKSPFHRPGHNYISRCYTKSSKLQFLSFMNNKNILYVLEQKFELGG